MNRSTSIVYIAVIFLNPLQFTPNDLDYFMSSQVIMGNSGHANHILSCVTNKKNVSPKNLFDG